MEPSDNHRETSARIGDAELVRHCLAGSQRAFAELVDRHKSMVYSLVDRSVGDPAVTDDLSQEVFLRVHRGLRGLAGPGDAKGLVSGAC